jgi:hypothetical protein
MTTNNIVGRSCGARLSFCRLPSRLPHCLSGLGVPDAGTFRGPFVFWRAGPGSSSKRWPLFSLASIGNPVSLVSSEGQPRSVPGSWTAMWLTGRSYDLPAVSSDLASLTILDRSRADVLPGPSTRLTPKTGEALGCWKHSQMRSARACQQRSLSWLASTVRKGQAWFDLQCRAAPHRRLAQAPADHDKILSRRLQLPLFPIAEISHTNADVISGASTHFVEWTLSTLESCEAGHIVFGNSL